MLHRGPCHLILLLVVAISSLIFLQSLAWLPPPSVARRLPTSLQRALRSTKTTIVMNNTIDEFGGDFLADFDVDAAVRARNTTPNETNNNNKRQKTDRDPFSENSPFTRGYTTNPIHELSSTIPPPQQQQHVPVVTQEALEETLQQYFGHSHFRPGQVQVLEAILQKRDAAVFWATGSGKSICYQIPPLFVPNGVALVVSPLISLMQDQVNKLNGLFPQPLATFLGSAQTDASEETAALHGAYRLVYVTPEKLLSRGFLNRLARSSMAHSLVCIAVDESHCVSEWGHDFRADYRRLHHIRRAIPTVPIVALTATAVPRVQEDIVTLLRLHDPLVARRSFDRPNLVISVQKKRGLHAAMEPLLSNMATQSTIVYAPTRDGVEEIAAWLAANLPQRAGDADAAAARVRPYHAGLSSQERTRAHFDFLTGTCKVIVATVAFGMGIDKPDTRRVVHYGPPKTVEEYYQQIGRAGRDGLPAECLMFVSDGDFDKYKSDFYVGNLQGELKANMLKSVDTLKSFALDPIKCRRKALLDFFQETSSFGERCGTCDTCQNVATYGEDAQREAEGARIVLKAINALTEQGLGSIEKVIAGNVIEPFRYSFGSDPQQVQQYIQNKRQELKTRVPASHFRELVAPLVSKGFVQEGNKTATINGYKRTWTTYSLTLQGKHALNDTSIPIVLPVTPTIREIERKAEEKRQRTLKNLSDAGVEIEKLPKEEIETGDGEYIRAFTKWHGYLESMRKNGRDERLAQLEDLRGRIETWRSSAAIKNRMAPAAVLAEHTLVFMAYTIASMKPGFKAEPNALIAAGVRTREIDSLVDTLNQWLQEVQPASPAETAESTMDDAAMTFPVGESFTPSKPWDFAVYKPMKKTGKASWESSHERFLNGEHPQTIAISPANGKPIQMNTVVGHILDGLVQGRAVPLDRLATFLPPPTKSEWNQLQQAEASTGMSVVDDPNTSGIGGNKFTMTEFLRPIMGDAFVDTPYSERTDTEKATFGHWCDKLKWYMALRRVNYEPSFSE